MGSRDVTAAVGIAERSHLIVVDILEHHLLLHLLLLATVEVYHSRIVLVVHRLLLLDAVAARVHLKLLAVFLLALVLALRSSEWIVSSVRGGRARS